jgi:hypothetical protein
VQRGGKGAGGGKAGKSGGKRERRGIQRRRSESEMEEARVPADGGGAPVPE